MTDEEIIEAVQKGNQNAFKELVQRYESRIAATVIGMLGNVQEAEDVGQETFIRFFKNINKFRGESTVATYLTRIAINLSLNELKRRKRRLQLFLKEPVDENYDVDDENNNPQFEERQELVHHAIQQLEPKFRSVVVLRMIDGYTTEETAKILKIPFGTVLSRLTRAQKKLKEVLSPFLEEII